MSSRKRSTRWIPLWLTVAAAAASMLVIGFLGNEPGAEAQTADAATQRIWRAKCSSCHGPDGRGRTKQGTKMAIPDITTAAFQKAQTDAQIRDRILDGVDRVKNGTKQKMEPFRTKLTAPQVQALVAYIRHLRH